MRRGGVAVDDAEKTDRQFIVSPSLLGSGRLLLKGMSTSLKLDLLEAKKYRSGNVLLRYTRPE